MISELDRVDVEEGDLNEEFGDEKKRKKSHTIFSRDKVKIIAAHDIQFSGD